MKWYFKCPECAGKLNTEWDRNGKQGQCPYCHKDIRIPTPSDQHDAYVDQHDWPQAMEDEVYKTKRTSCVISGCRNREMSLDHITAWDNGGKTSVENLQPMCKKHNSSKGNTRIGLWLAIKGLTLRKV